MKINAEMKQRSVGFLMNTVIHRPQLKDSATTFGLAALIASTSH